MADTVHFEQRGSIGLITMKNPPVNALGIALRRGLTEAIAQATSDGASRRWC